MRPCFKENKPERLDFTAGMTRLLSRKGSQPTSQFLLLVTMFLFGKALKSLQVTKQRGRPRKEKRQVEEEAFILKTRDVRGWGRRASQDHPRAGPTNHTKQPLC